jgi:hypothetical protein
MPLDDAVFIHLLWRGIIVGIGVSEKPCDQILDLHFDIKGLVFHKRIREVRRIDKLARRHLVLRRNAPDGSRIAGSTINLLPVSDRYWPYETKIDKVVAASFRSHLTGFGIGALSIPFKAFHDVGRV